LCWQAKQNILSETDYANGLLPKCEVVEEKENLLKIEMHLKLLKTIQNKQLP